VAKIVTMVAIPIVFVTILILGITSSAHAQTNATTSKQASESIRGAITSTGQFLNNATQKIAGSKSAQTIVNESSDVLGNATIATKKYFSPK